MHAMLSDRLHVTAALSARPTIRRRSSRFGDQAEHLRTWRRGNGYDALVLPGADTSVEHPKNRKSTWVIGSRRSAHRVGVDPKHSIGGTPDHRWSIQAARQPGCHRTEGVARVAQESRQAHRRRHSCTPCRPWHRPPDTGCRSRAGPGRGDQRTSPGDKPPQTPTCQSATSRPIPQH